MQLVSCVTSVVAVSVKFKVLLGPAIARNVRGPKYVGPDSCVRGRTGRTLAGTSIRDASVCNRYSHYIVCMAALNYYTACGRGTIEYVRAQVSSIRGTDVGSSHALPW